MTASNLRDQASTLAAMRSSRSLVLLLVVLWTGVHAGCQPDTRMSVGTFLAMEAAAGRLDQADPTPPTSTQPAETVLDPWHPGPYKIGPGDVITVNVAGLEAVGLPGEYTLRVNEAGQIGLPSIGRIPVGGMILDEVEETIKSAYAPRFIKETQVTAEITAYRPIDLIVLGEVRTPAPIELRRDRSSILQAILASGGPTEFADGRVTLIPARAPDQVVSLDLNKREDLVRAAKAGAIQDSDVLIVERRSADVVYVQGLVQGPGPVPMPKGTTMSVLQAICAAGGTLLEFCPTEATLMRRRPNGELVRVKLELDRIKAGQDPDIALAAGDMLVVPHNASTRFEEFLARAFIFRFGLDTTFSPWTHYYFQKDRESREQFGGGGEGFFGTFGRQLSTMDLTPLLTTPAQGRP